MEIVEKLEKAGLDADMIDKLYALFAERLTDIGKKIAKRERDETELIWEGKLRIMESQASNDFLNVMAYAQSHENELYYAAGLEDGIKLIRGIVSL